MSRDRRAFVLACLVAAVCVAGPGPAGGQVQTGDQVRCIERMNRNGRAVSSAQGTENLRCVRRASKGRITDLAACLTADARGDVADEEQDTIDDEAERCLLLPEQAPDFGKTDAATVNTAAVDEQIDFFGDLFGPSLNTAVILRDADRAGSVCQVRVLKYAGDLLRMRLSEFNKCKKDGLKDGLITDAAGMEACMGQDARGRIADARAKLAARIDRRCTRRGVPQATAFPGLCATASLLDCIDDRTACHTCEMLNDMDGLDANCDVIDDGVLNGSCGMPLHKCVLAPSPASEIQIHLVALPVPIAIGVSGSLDLRAAGEVVECAVQSFDPLYLPGIGFVCVGPGGPCAPGVRHCGPGSGPPLGVDVTSDGDIGTCASNASCNTACDAVCAGAGKTRLEAGCTGYCSGGSQGACTSDAQCHFLPEDGACNGPDPVAPAQAGICQCTCVDTAAHGASDPGDFRCNLGAYMTVETSMPCDGTDVLVDAGGLCIPLTTQRATGSVTDANFTPGQVVPPAPNVNDQTGASVACPTLDSSVSTGIVAVGAVNAFGTALGDLSIGLKATCQ